MVLRCDMILRYLSLLLFAVHRSQAPLVYLFILVDNNPYNNKTDLQWLDVLVFVKKTEAGFSYLFCRYYKPNKGGSGSGTAWEISMSLGNEARARSADLLLASL